MIKQRKEWKPPARRGIAHRQSEWAGLSNTFEAATPCWNLVGQVEW